MVRSMSAMPVPMRRSENSSTTAPANLSTTFFARGVERLRDLVEPEVRPVLHCQRRPQQRQPDEAEARDLLAPRIRVREEVAHQDLEEDDDADRDQERAHGGGLESDESPVGRVKPFTAVYAFYVFWRILQYVLRLGPRHRIALLRFLSLYRS